MCDISDPELIRPTRFELSINEVWSRSLIFIAFRGLLLLTASYTDQLRCPHQPCYAFFTHFRALGFELSVNTWCAINPARLDMGLSDTLS